MSADSHPMRDEPTSAASIEIAPKRCEGMVKRVATARARGALRGIVLIESRDDRGQLEWIASLHAMTKAFSSLDDLERWLDRIEGKR